MFRRKALWVVLTPGFTRLYQSSLRFLWPLASWRMSLFRLLRPFFCWLFIYISLLSTIQLSCRAHTILVIWSIALVVFAMGAYAYQNSPFKMLPMIKQKNDWRPPLSRHTSEKARFVTEKGLMQRFIDFSRYHSTSSPPLEPLPTIHKLLCRIAFLTRLQNAFHTTRFAQRAFKRSKMSHSGTD